MQYDQFVGQVQSRARLASKGETVRVIRATLETLARRLVEGEVKDLASQLPSEIGYYLHQGKEKEKYSLDEFFTKVSKIENVPVEKARAHSRAVISVVREAVSPGEINDILAGLPGEFSVLFGPEEKEGKA